MSVRSTVPLKKLLVGWAEGGRIQQPLFPHPLIQIDMDPQFYNNYYVPPLLIIEIIYSPPSPPPPPIIEFNTMMHLPQNWFPIIDTQYHEVSL